MTHSVKTDLFLMTDIEAHLTKIGIDCRTSYTYPKSKSLYFSFCTKYTKVIMLKDIIAQTVADGFVIIVCCHGS